MLGRIKFDTFRWMWPFAETVLLWRLHRGLTQVDLAKAAGISRPNLCAIENGVREVTLPTLRALACALDITPGVLADGRSPYGEPLSMSRDEMERVARAAALGLQEPKWAQLVACLRTLTVSRRALNGGSKDKPESRRATLQAHLMLKAMVSADTLQSLLSRLSAYAGQT